MTSLRTELEFAVQVAEEAGKLTLEYFQRSGVKTERKSDDSPVTVADYEAERLIRSRIASQFPNDGILGEEEGEVPGTSGRRWTIDPIDGTKSFVQGVPLYGVLIGLEAAGEALVGVVGIPGVGDMVAAARGEGCFWNGAPTRVSPVDRLDESFLVYTSCNNFHRCGDDGRRALTRSIDACREMRSWGDGYGYGLGATGRADAMFDPLINPWDLTPVIPIVTEAGGTVTDWAGQTPPLDGEGWPKAVATNGHLRASVLQLLNP